MANERESATQIFQTLEFTPSDWQMIINGDFLRPVCLYESTFTLSKDKARRFLEQVDKSNESNPYKVTFFTPSGQSMELKVIRAGVDKQQLKTESPNSETVKIVVALTQEEIWALMPGQTELFGY